MTSNPSDTSDNNYEWELCRENVRPAKHGRRVDTINKTLTQAVCNAEKIATTKLDEIFEQCEQCDDPLEKCLEFCAWFEDVYPNGKQRLFYTLLWRIVHKYIQNGDYAQDARTLRIWEKLADNSMGHGNEVYQHAHQFGCLLEHTEFYIYWARDLEDRGAVAHAREILHKGRLNGAVPIEDLDEEEDQLEMREMRRQLENASIADEEDSDEWEDEENESRRVFTRVTALDGDEVPVVRLPSIVGEQGPRRLELSSHKLQEKAQPTTVEVFEDEENAEPKYLEDIFDIHSSVHSGHIERYALKDNNSIKLIANKEVSKKPTAPSSSFVVWQDENADKENINPQEKNKTEETGKCKQKLAISKKFVEISFEEAMAEKYLADSGVRRKLSFDDDDE